MWTTIPSVSVAAAAGTVEQGERREESTAKRYERSKRDFPLAARGINYESAFFGRVAQTEYQ